MPVGYRELAQKLGGLSHGSTTMAVCSWTEQIGGGKIPHSHAPIAAVIVRSMLAYNFEAGFTSLGNTRTSRPSFQVSLSLS